MYLYAGLATATLLTWRVVGHGPAVRAAQSVLLTSVILYGVRPHLAAALGSLALLLTTVTGSASALARVRRGAALVRPATAAPATALARIRPLCVLLCAVSLLAIIRPDAGRAVYFPLAAWALLLGSALLAGATRPAPAARAGVGWGKPEEESDGWPASGATGQQRGRTRDNAAADPPPPLAAPTDQPVPVPGLVADPAPDRGRTDRFRRPDVRALRPARARLRRGRGGHPGARLDGVGRPPVGRRRT